jgi:hypothetical protein
MRMATTWFREPIANGTSKRAIPVTACMSISEGPPQIWHAGRQNRTAHCAQPTGHEDMAQEKWRHRQFPGEGRNLLALQQCQKYSSRRSPRQVGNSRFQ